MTSTQVMSSSDELKQYTRDQLLALYLPSTEVIDVPEDLPFLSATSLSPASFDPFDMQEWIKQWQSQKTSGKNNGRNNGPHTPNHSTHQQPQTTTPQWKRGEKVDVKDQGDLWDDVLEENDGGGLDGSSSTFDMGLEDMAIAAEKFRLEMNKMHGKVTTSDIPTAEVVVEPPIFDTGRLVSDSTSLSQSQLDTFASFSSLSVENAMQGATTPLSSKSVLDTKTSSSLSATAWNTLAPPLDEVWFYLDPQGNQQGSFQSSEMRDWFEAGYFKPNLPIRKGHSGVFTPLAALFVNGQSPFALLPVTSVASSNFGQLFQKDAQHQQHQMELQRQQQQQQLELQEKQQRQLELQEQQQRQLELQEQQRRAQQQLQLEQQQQQMLEQQRQMMEQQRVMEQQRQQQHFMEQQAQAQQRQMIEQQLQLEQQHRLQQQQQKMEETRRLEQQQQEILRQQQQQVLLEQHQAHTQARQMISPSSSSSSSSPTSFGWGLGGLQIPESTSSYKSNAAETETTPQQPSWGTVPIKKRGSLKEIQEEEAIAAAEALKKEMHLQQQFAVEAAAQAAKAPVTMAERLTAHGSPAVDNLANMGAQLKMMLGVQPPASKPAPVAQAPVAPVATSGWNNPSQAVMAVKKTMKEILEEEEQARRQQVVNSNHVAGGPMMPVSKSSKWASIVTGGNGHSAMSLIPSSQQKIMLAQKQKPQPPTQILKKPSVTENSKSSSSTEDATFWNFSETNSAPAVAPAAVPQTNEFMKWVSMRIKKLGGMEDTSLLTFCASLEDPTEIREYIAGYLGSTPAVSAFATEFIQRKKLIKSKKQTTAAAAGTSSSTSATSGKKNRRSKKKGQKLDASLLGFSRVPSSNRPNQGEIDYGN